MPPCYHSWELNRDASFFDMVIEVWQKVLGMDTTEKATCAREQLRSIEHLPCTSNTHPKQVTGLKSVHNKPPYGTCSHFVVSWELFPGDCFLLQDEVTVWES